MNTQITLKNWLQCCPVEGGINKIEMNLVKGKCHLISIVSVGKEQLNIIGHFKLE